MSVVKREDGIKFVIHTYREVLLSQRSFKIKEEIRLLAQSHGEYVRFFREDEQIEAIFSKEPGFLLAESVWYYFNRPSDLIYCEILPDQTNALLVIIQRNTVYLDAKLPIASIQDEIASFMTGDNQYHVFVFGNAPISDTAEPGKLILSKEDLAAFTRLQESAFEKLPADEKLQLQPLNLALRTQRLGKSSFIPLIAGIVVLFLLALGGWYGWTSDDEQEGLPKQKEIERPFATYETTLSHTKPLDQVFEDFSNLLAFSASLPGWQINNITYEPDTYRVNVKPQGQLSSLQVLERWLKKYGLKFSFKKEGVQFTVPAPVEKRERIPEVKDVTQVVIEVIDKLKKLLPIGAEIHVENESRMGLTQGVEVKISFSSTSPDVLILLGREFLSFPVFVKEMNFSMENNLLSGSVQLMVLGK